jgi:hypothetical protein
MTQNVLKPCSYLVLLLSVFSLGGCINLYDETFDCQFQKGVGCKSIAQVDHLVNEGTLALREEEETPSPKEPFLPPKENHQILSSTPEPPLILGTSGAVTRLPETWRRIWIASYQDGEGTFYEGFYAHTVVSPGLWLAA